ncbi:hypothetical protein [Natronorubrum halophilum]|uniref:hypothetical protein n=1 Tax=Natronorubrum halophilum TaxID=1702106 RepID=UPI000EF64322|nr:hypothetical protein [Natronorubrum halophilum]
MGGENEVVTPRAVSGRANGCLPITPRRKEVGGFSAIIVVGASAFSFVIDDVVEASPTHSLSSAVPESVVTTTVIPSRSNT